MGLKEKDPPSHFWCIWHQVYVSVARSFLQGQAASLLPSLAMAENLTTRMGGTMES